MTEAEQDAEPFTWWWVWCYHVGMCISAIADEGYMWDRCVKKSNPNEYDPWFVVDELVNSRFLPDSSTQLACDPVLAELVAGLARKLLQIPNEDLSRTPEVLRSPLWQDAVWQSKAIMRHLIRSGWPKYPKTY